MGSKSGDLIRNTIIIVLSSIIYGIIITGCSDNTSFKSTELNNVFIDNLNIGSSIQNINLKKYTESNRYSGDYMCKFEELIIDSEDNKVKYLCGRFDEKRIVISINNKRNLSYIYEVSEILGYNYKEKWKDREQQLKEYIYYDNINGIKAELIYSDFDSSLAWVTLSKVKNY